MQAGYFLKPDVWEVAFRYGFSEANELLGFQITEIGGAVGYFYNKHNLKVQADFRRISTESATGETDNHEFRIQTQFIF